MVSNAPSNIQASVTEDDVTVTWVDNETSEDGYRVWYREVNQSTWQSSADLPADTEQHTVTSLLDGREYRFAVEVFDSDSSVYGGAESSEF